MSYKKNTNSIVFCKDNYPSETDWELAIGDAVMMLLNADYIMTVRYDEKGLGIVVIEFEHDDCSYGGAYPYWLEPEEIEQVVFNNEREEE